MKITDLLTQADAGKLISRIAEAAVTLTADIHLAACSTLDHARAHGDWTGIVRLMDSLPKSQRVKALAYWYSVMSNGRVVLSVDAETKSYRVNKDKFANRTDADFEIEKAMATTYADLTVEKNPEPLTVEKFLKSLKRTAVNADNFEGTEIPKVSPRMRAVASSLVPLVQKALDEAA